MSLRFGAVRTGDCEVSYPKQGLSQSRPMGLLEDNVWSIIDVVKKAPTQSSYFLFCL